MTKRLRHTRLLAAAAAVALLGALGATAASAGNTASSCPTYATAQPFLSKWADAGYYFLGPAGAFESTLSGWTASGGAKIVNGNETYFVNSGKDNHSLSLPKGSSVASPSVCVTSDTPDLRLFVKNTGSASATLNVNMTYTDKRGKPSTVTVASLTGSSSWSLSAPVLFLANIQPLVDRNNCTWVTFTFAPVGSNGNWLVDDFYVDPVKHH